MRFQPSLGPSTVSITALLLRWLVVLVVALDLISSPLHAHVHDVGADAHLMGSHFRIGSGSNALDSILRVELPTIGQGSHSTAAIRSAGLQSPSSPELISYANLAPATAPEVDDSGDRFGFRASDVIDVAKSWRLSLRPEGRAPPVISA